MISGQVYRRELDSTSPLVSTAETLAPNECSYPRFWGFMAPSLHGFISLWQELADLFISLFCMTETQMKSKRENSRFKWVLYTRHDSNQRELMRLEQVDQVSTELLGLLRPP